MKRIFKIQKQSKKNFMSVLRKMLNTKKRTRKRIT
jgi:hypothetical protein